MKKCTKCQRELDTSAFYKNKAQKDGLYPWCKECTKAKNTKYFKSKASSSIKERNRKYLLSHLLLNPCVDCGETDVRVLEFDHLPEFEKVGGVAQMAASTSSLEKLQREIDKCEVRCRNHHRIKTLERQGVVWHAQYLEELL